MTLQLDKLTSSHLFLFRRPLSMVSPARGRDGRYQSLPGHDPGPRQDEVMKALQVGEFKARFSEVLKEVVKGNPVAIEYGRKKEMVAVIVPHDQYKPGNLRTLGVLDGKATCVIRKDFKLTDEDFLSS